jgi:hypothetical protein
MGGWVLYGAQISWPGCREIDRRFFAQKFREFRECFSGSTWSGQYGSVLPYEPGQSAYFSKM